MTDWTAITIEQFEAAYNKYPASGWIKFAFKYFSQETEMSKMMVRNNISIFLIGLFIFGFFGTVFEVNRKIVEIITILYSILLILLTAYLFSAVFLNDFRITNVRKELGITKIEYNKLIEKLYY